MKSRKIYLAAMALILGLSLVFGLNYSPTAEKADEAWTFNEAVKGGLGGMTVSFTNLDSASNTASQWSDVPSLFDASSKISMYYLYNAPAADSAWVYIQTRLNSNLYVYADSLLIIGAASPAPTAVNVSLSNWGPQWRIVYAPTGNPANASTDDLEIGFYSPDNDVINDRMNYLRNYTR